MAAVVVTENETAQPVHAAAAAAAANDDGNAKPAPPAAAEPKLLDPQLLMAACHGDSERLKELLRLNKDDEEKEEHVHGGMVEEAAAAASSEVVIVEVVPRHPPAPPPAPTRSAGSASAPLPPALDADDGVTKEGDTLLHMVAASGDGPGFLRCARMIVRRHSKQMIVVHGQHHHHQQQVLEARNNNGDTPLHCAARAGNVNMISCLVDLTIAADAAVAAKKFLRIQNGCGETALHQAIRAPKNKMECIDQLMDVDPELACIPPREEEGACASPLYLAISLGEVEIAQHLFRTSGGKLSYSGPHGRNVLHSAVSCGTALPVVLGWLIEGRRLRMREEGDGQEAAAADHRRDATVLWQLTNQRDKENGSTPLHLAASLGGLPRARSLLLPWQVEPPAPAMAATRLLLDANESAAYQPDDKSGLYPIHVAAGVDSLGVVEALLGRCPGCATLRDAKGRTFLHVAAEEGSSEVVGYVCGQSQQTQEMRRRRYWMSRPRPADDDDAAVAVLLSSILNAQDINGDTPLHRAVHAGYHPVVQDLIGNQQVRLDIPNNMGMRPVDVSWSMMPVKAYYAWDRRIHIRRSLLEVGAPYGESRGDLFHEKRKGILPKGATEEKTSDDLTDAAQVLALFSVLITTVTFASAFTLPGGYRSAGDAAAGTAVLAGSYAFDAFVLSNGLAFMCSFFATTQLLYAGVAYGTLENRFRLINGAYGLMWCSGRSLVTAFALGLYVVLLPVARKTAIAICVFMLLLGVGILKESEGIKSFQLIRPYRRSRTASRWSPRHIVLNGILPFFDHFWSFIIIFGLPAIRKWKT